MSMRKFRIFADSTCDLTQERADALGIEVLPIGVGVGGTQYMHYADCRELPMDKFYIALRDGLSATTSATSPGAWEDAFRKALSAGSDVLAVTLSSGLSCTYSNACMAAAALKDEFPARSIYIVDSRSGSLGIGSVLELAASLGDKGLTIGETSAHLEAAVGRLNSLFTVDDLKHLLRGGRISAATATVGSILNIKPIIAVQKDGSLGQLAKIRGRKGSLKYLADAASSSSRVYVTHADAPEDAEALKAMIEEKNPACEVILGSIGPALGAHCGPGAIAAFFYSGDTFAGPIKITPVSAK